MVTLLFTGAGAGVGLLAGARPAAATTDVLFPLQWALSQIGAPQPAALGTGVTIGIVDSGIDRNHPDLVANILTAADCIGGACREGPNAGQDSANGHGTHVSGIAAASADNHDGIAGVAPGAKLAVAKVLDAEGQGTLDDVRAGIAWVLSKGARVINLSLGPELELLPPLLGGGNPLRSAIEQAWTSNAIPVLAAGNGESLGLLEGGDNQDLNAVFVGATDRAGGRSSYSSPLGNAKWGLLAPGGSGGGGPERDVVSTVPNGLYASRAGTSMAAPHVAGALAVLLGQGLGKQQAIDRMLATVDTSVPGCDGADGCRGRLNVARAVSPASAPPPSPPLTDPAPASPGTGSPGSGSPGSGSAPGSGSPNAQPAPSSGGSPTVTGPAPGATPSPSPSPGPGTSPPPAPETAAPAPPPGAPAPPGASPSPWPAVPPSPPPTSPLPSSPPSPAPAPPPPAPVSPPPTIADPPLALPAPEVATPPAPAADSGASIQSSPTTQPAPEPRAALVAAPAPGDPSTAPAPSPMPGTPAPRPAVAEPATPSPSAPNAPTPRRPDDTRARALYRGPSDRGSRVALVAASTLVLGAAATALGLALRTRKEGSLA